MFSYLLALGEIAAKVWNAPDKLAAIRSLSASERFVLKLTFAMVVFLVKTQIAL